MSHFVYWVHLPDQDIFTEGYVGVTNNPERRWKEHVDKLHCPHFGNAIKKYADNLIWKIVFEGTADCCYKKEAYYRPAPNIGWNIAQGGAIGNNLNRKMSEATRKKMSKSRKGSIPWSKGKTGIYSEETLQKIGKATKARSQGKDNPMYGKNIPKRLETR